MNELILKHLERINKANKDCEGCVKVFISQFTFGKDKKTIQEERKVLEHNAVINVKDVFEHVDDLQVEIMDSFLDDFETPLHADRRVYMLGESIKLLSFADVLYAPYNWANSNGTYIEHMVAEKYHKKIIYYQDGLTTSS